MYVYYVHCTHNMLSFGFLLRLLPFFSLYTHIVLSVVCSVYTSACYNIQNIFIRFIFILYSLSNFLNQSEDLVGAIPGFQYNYKHTPPSIYNSLVSSRLLVTFVFFFFCLLAIVLILFHSYSVCSCTSLLLGSNNDQVNFRNGLWCWTHN